MKGLAIITHPGGADGATYSVEIYCLDKNGLVLPDNLLKVTQTEDNN